MTRQNHNNVTVGRIVDPKSSTSRVTRKTIHFAGDSGARGEQFQALEPRRLMSASTDVLGAVFDGHTLSLTGQGAISNQMRVELDVDGTHVRGVVNGQAGEWLSVSQVRRIQIGGGDKSDTVRIDSRLAGRALPISIASDVENVRVTPTARSLDAYRKDWALQEARRLATHLSAAGTTAQLEQVSLPVQEDARPVQLPRIHRLALVDAVTNQEIPGYHNLLQGTDIPLSELNGRKINIVAHLEGGQGDFAGSIQFEMGSWKHVENYAPWAVYGDNNGNFNGWTPEAKLYTLKATVFSGKGATGQAGPTLQLDLRFAAPNPVVDPPPPTGGGTNTGGTNTGGTTVNPSAPVVHISAVTTSVYAGQSLHVTGLGTLLNNGNVQDASFEWDFGDSGSRFNQVRGFVAAHVYANPGAYTVTLKVTDKLGNASTRTLQVNVQAVQRSHIYVSPHGSDSNDGRSSGAAVKSIQRVQQLLDGYGNHVEILFQRGQQHSFGTTLNVAGSNVVVRAYGSGDRPMLVWSGGLDTKKVMISTAPGSRQVMVRDLAFTAPGSDPHGKQNRPSAIRPLGDNVAVLNNAFYDIGDAVNANGKPTGVLVQDNSSPTATGLREYFVWGEGRQLTILGNTVANSTREHIIRLGGAEGVTISGNNLTNLDRRPQGDAYDIAKGVIVMQKGKFGYVTDNQIHVGGGGVGPLGEGDGLSEPGARWQYAIWENNTFHDETFYVEHGAEYVNFRYNLLQFNNKMMIQIEGWQHDYQRTSRHITIHGNVGINYGTQGQFMRTYEGIVNVSVTNNTYIAPNMHFGPYHAAAMVISAPNMNGFTRISGNLWPANSNLNGWAQGGVHYVGTGYSQQGYLTPQQWLGHSVVSNDLFGPGNAQQATTLVLNTYGVPMAA